MAAIVAAADGAAGAAAGHHFGPTEEEVRQRQYKSLLRERGPVLEINCGGVVHCVYEETLRRVPHTLLANIVDDEAVRAKLPRDEKGRIFFDRHPQAFYEILNYYRTGILIAPPTMVRMAWESELRFFSIDVAKKDRSAESSADLFRPADGWRLSLFLVLEDPSSSFLARIVSMISLGVIVTSVTCLCAETIFDSECDETGCHEVPSPEVFALIETACIIWFTTEYLLRLIASRNKGKFVKAVMNVIDVLAIAPFYVTLISKLVSGGEGGGSSFAIVRVIRLVRIFRVFKLGKHSSGLVVLGRTISGSMNELMLLLFFLAMGVLLFATAVYYCEHGRDGEGLDDNPLFISIPHAFWWAIVTMTTLGYGDLYPVTPAGMIIGSMCSITGVIMIALPMVVIGQNFADHYSQMRMEEQEREIEEAAARKQSALSPRQPGSESPTGPGKEKGKDLDGTEDTLPHAETKKVDAVRPGALPGQPDGAP